MSSAQINVMMMSVLRNSWRPGTGLQCVNGVVGLTLCSRRPGIPTWWPTSASVESVSQRPPPSEEQHEEWRRPPATNQDKPVRRAFRNRGTYWTCGQAPRWNPQDGSRVRSMAFSGLSGRRDITAWVLFQSRGSEVKQAGNLWADNFLSIPNTH